MGVPKNHHTGIFCQVVHFSHKNDFSKNLNCCKNLISDCFPSMKYSKSLVQMRVKKADKIPAYPL